jgi:hypothetical protein
MAESRVGEGLRGRAVKPLTRTRLAARLDLSLKGEVNPSDVEPDPLGQRQACPVVNCIGGAAHVGLP